MSRGVDVQSMNATPLLHMLDGADAVSVLLDGVTAREAEVAGLVARGLTNKEIASQLHVSARTIQTHLERTFKKLGVRSRGELAARVYLAIVRKHNE
ncbi:MAG: helix-turn-helix transcriptional regulator [Nitrospira sp.]|nr:helix-turn-helix transcriptional regulator [Nitrospira sp.]